MEMPDGWKSLKDKVYSAKYPISMLTVLEHLKEMAEALEKITNDWDLLHEDFNGAIDPDGIEALKKFKEWK